MATIDYDIYKPGTKRLVFMVSNRTFPDPLKHRNSAVTDGDLNVFKHNFGFDYCSSNGKDEIVVNANRAILDKELDYVQNRLKKGDVSCLAVILSSHGWEQIDGSKREHFIVCSDGKLYKTSDIINKLDTNIPVIFVIQACRHVSGDPEEEKVDRGVSIVIVDDEKDEKFADARYFANTTIQEEDDSTLVPACALHTSVFFSSSDRKKAFRHIEGGWLFVCLNKVVEKKKTSGDKEISLFDLFTSVNSEMSQMEADIDSIKMKRLKSASSFLHQMTNKLLLRF